MIDASGPLTARSKRPMVSALMASGYPRPIPGIPNERNLQGISFAVANMSGFAARALEGLPGHSAAALRRALMGHSTPESEEP